jgi:hypothetical protein
VRLYVVGMEGQIARSLGEATALNPDIVFGCSRRAERRLATPRSDRKSVLTFSPDIVINPAVYTAILLLIAQNPNPRLPSRWSENRRERRCEAWRPDTTSIDGLRLRQQKNKALTSRRIRLDPRPFTDVQSLRGSMLWQPPTSAT